MRNNSRSHYFPRGKCMNVHELLPDIGDWHVGVAGFLSIRTGLLYRTREKEVPTKLLSSSHIVK